MVIEQYITNASNDFSFIQENTLFKASILPLSSVREMRKKNHEKIKRNLFVYFFNFSYFCNHFNYFSKGPRPGPGLYITFDCKGLKERTLIATYLKLLFFSIRSVYIFATFYQNKKQYI